MKAFFADGNGKGHFEELPIPAVGEDDVLVKVSYCGICGTDQDLFSGNCSFAENGQVTYPDRLGHEWSGIVEQVGAKVTAFRVGDRVVGDNGVSCNVCEDCKSGNYLNCKHTFCVGTINPVYDGAFCEHFLFPARHLHRIPDNISLKEAALCEPFSVAYGGIKKMDIQPKSIVAIIGTGCIGMAAAVLAKCRGAARVIMLGRNPKKLAVAEALGVETVNCATGDAVEEFKKLTGGREADFVCECSGAAGTFTQAMQLVVRYGTVALIGFYEKLETAVNIDTLVSKAISLYGIMGSLDDMEGVLALLKQHRPDLTPMITDELEFADCMKGFVRTNYPYSIKTMVRIGGEE